MRPICRFEGVAGEFTQHDFGQVVVEWIGGERTRVHFFASRLKYSRYSLITPVADQRLKTLVRTLATDFERFGGLPLIAVFDRPRTIVTKSDPKTPSLPISVIHPLPLEFLRRAEVDADATVEKCADSSAASSISCSASTAIIAPSTARRSA